jgi:hypothetical protein
MNVRNPVWLDQVHDEKEKNARVESDAYEQAERKELLTLVGERLPLGLRPAFLRLRAGLRVRRDLRDQVIQAAREVFGESLAA